MCLKAAQKTQKCSAYQRQGSGSRSQRKEQLAHLRAPITAGVSRYHVRVSSAVGTGQSPTSYAFMEELDGSDKSRSTVQCTTYRDRDTIHRTLYVCTITSGSVPAPGSLILKWISTSSSLEFPSLFLHLNTPCTVVPAAITWHEHLLYHEAADVPSCTTMGSLSKNRVCFQCVGTDAGPVLKLMYFGFGFFSGSPELIRLEMWGLRPICQTSARMGSPSAAT